MKCTKCGTIKTSKYCDFCGHSEYIIVVPLKDGDKNDCDTTSDDTEATQ